MTHIGEEWKTPPGTVWVTDGIPDEIQTSFRHQKAKSMCTERDIAMSKIDKLIATMERLARALEAKESAATPQYSAQRHLRPS